MPLAASIKMLLLAATTLASPVAAQFGPCPADTVSCPPDTYTSAPAYDVECQLPGSEPYWWRVQYDLRAGWIRTDTHHPVAEVIASDDYIVTGLPAGTVVSLTLKAQVQITTQMFGGSGQARVRVGNEERVFSAGNGSPGDALLNVPVAVAVGEPFRAHYQVQVSSGTPSPVAYAGMSFRFAGMPPGTSIVSCQGYTQDAPTPVLRGSWGAAKILYRR